MWKLDFNEQMRANESERELLSIHSTCMKSSADTKLSM